MAVAALPASIRTQALVVVSGRRRTIWGEKAFGSEFLKPTKATMTCLEIESFIRAFEDCSLPNSEWNHAKHLIMALWYIRRHGRDEATTLIREGIRRYNECQGNLNGYHETITLAWVAVIEQFLATRDRDVAVSALIAELLEVCGERDYLLRFYSRERLFSDEARRRWVTPDVAEVQTCRAQRGGKSPASRSSC
jgi:hypothetical protein